MNKKKIGIIIAAAVAVAAAAGGIAWYYMRGGSAGGSKADKVYVESVASLTGAAAGVQNRYSGVVEPQETWEVNKNAEKTVKEKFVKEGDSVEVGTPLFEYDTETLKSELAQANLELEGMKNEITNYEAQIKQLKEEKAAASEEEKFQYTSQIQNIQNSIKQSEYNIESKKIEMEKKQQSIDNAAVTSQIAGVVKSINESGMDSMTGQPAPFMTILATGEYRIKGAISEQTVGMISEGQPVILRSRTAEDQTWTGTISKIDMESQQSGNNNNEMIMGGSTDNIQTSSKYPFYIALDSADGLILGQHVYIELNEGQTEKKEGLWLFEGYIGQDEDEPYVWAANKKDRLEKRKVELGEYDENLGEYQIVSGLTEEDSIAFPMPGLYEGVATVTDVSEVDYSAPLYNQDGNGDGADGPVEVLPEDGMSITPEGGEDMIPEGKTEEGQPGDDSGTVETESPSGQSLPAEEPEG